VRFEVLNSAFASRIADATAEVRFLRATTSVAAPFRNTAQVCAASSHWMRYSIQDVLRVSRGRALETGQIIDWFVGIAKPLELFIAGNFKTVRAISSI
jgi:predicted PP-loop superfamily ATPase